MVTPVANVPSAVRKSRGSMAELSLANSLAGSAGCLGASDIQRTSERKIFRRQAQCYASIVGPCGIEIEGKVRIDRVSVAELALQRTGHEQAPCATCCKQKRYRLGAEIDGKRSIPPQSRLCGDAGNMTASCVRHNRNAARAHDKTRCVDLGRRF